MRATSACTGHRRVFSGSEIDMMSAGGWMKKKKWAPGVFAAVLLCMLGIVHAQDGYPSKAIRIIVPFTPGSATDVVARLLGEKLTAAWGQPAIVENRVGAGGTI